MLAEKLRGHTLILASGSPRRQRFLREMGLPFEIRIKAVDEVYPEGLRGGQISDYLAELKAQAFHGTLKDHEIVVTSDTVVWHKGTSLAKASDETEAYRMLKRLSGDRHEVITSVTFTSNKGQKTVNQSTEVRFRPLTDREIHHYIEHYRPFDKAGAYGIQEWIGLIGIESIKGSYTNVVGLPTQLFQSTLEDLLDSQFV